VRYAGGLDDFLSSSKKEKKPMEDLKVGMKVDGKVISKMKDGILVDFGYKKYGLVNAPFVQAHDALKRGAEITGMTVDEVLDKGARLGVPDLPKPRPLSDFKVGDTIDGKMYYGRLDIGADVLAYIDAPKADVARLKADDEFKGARVEVVDLETRYLKVSVPGLSELVKDREFHKAKSTPKSQTQKTVPKDEQVQKLELNGHGIKGGGRKIELTLKGGLMFDSVGENGKIYLTKK
jgi:hypothetical protein